MKGGCASKWLKIMRLSLLCLLAVAVVCIMIQNIVMVLHSGRGN